MARNNKSADQEVPLMELPLHPILKAPPARVVLFNGVQYYFYEIPTPAIVAARYVELSQGLLLLDLGITPAHLDAFCDYVSLRAISIKQGDDAGKMKKLAAEIVAACSSITLARERTNIDPYMHVGSLYYCLYDEDPNSFDEFTHRQKIQIMKSSESDLFFFAEKARQNSMSYSRLSDEQFCEAVKREISLPRIS